MTWRRAFYALAVLVVVGAIALAVCASIVRDRLALSVHPGDSVVTLNIEPGSTLKTVTSRLSVLTGYAHPELLNGYARWYGFAGDIRAGEYRIEPGTSVEGFFDQVRRGQVVLHAVTVIEGWTFREFLAALHSHEHILATLKDNDVAAIMDKLGHPDVHPEGRFFPDTYRFERGTPDIVILNKAFDAMSTKLAQAWQARSGKCPLESPEAALILASIVEKETSRNDERRRVAGVFCRRLKRGMRLQTDPTVIYGIGPEFNGDITRKDLRTDTPYNTYTRGGLPPTPISLPGAASLAAAVDPDDGQSLYFVATGKPDGSHRFSNTLAEHNQAVAEYLRARRRAP
ncbi:MAG: endolytic transglycosylase MltG [Pseudomonadota bacterium]